jgi:MFS family permease
MTDDPHDPALRDRSARRRAELAELGGDDAVAMYFKERVYATFTGLAIVLVVAGDDHADAAHALTALVLGVLGITAAGFVSDVISHLAAHREFPSRTQVALLLRVAGGALGTLVIPVILLGLAALDVMSFSAALRAAIIVYIVTLGLVGWFAVRRSRVEWWKQLLALLALMLLGLGVVALQTIAHAA